MQVVVCYDIVEDKRRARIVKHLKGYLEHVQKSVFEGDLDDARLHWMKMGIQGRINMETDTVRIYRLCARCTPLTEIIGLGVYVEGRDKDKII